MATLQDQLAKAKIEYGELLCRMNPLEDNAENLKAADKLLNKIGRLESSISVRAEAAKIKREAIHV